MIVKNRPRLRTRNLAELVRRLGDIPLHRVRMTPAPGTATLEDAIAAERCELIDRCLVEKAMGLRESLIAAYLIRVLGDFVDKHNLGIVTGEQGTMQILPWTVRIPDVAFVAWSQMPGGKLSSEPIPPLTPTLAIEVISESNTPREMKRKRREFFKAGTKRVWEIDPRKRTARDYHSATRKTELSEDDTLDGGVILPRLKIALRDVFAVLDRAERGGK